MPMRTLYLQSSDDDLDLTSPLGFNCAESNLFDNTSNTDVNVEGWQDWMKWDGGAVDLETPIQTHRGGISGSVSPIDLWSTDIESAGNGITSATFLNGNEFPFEDAPFEMEDLSQSCHSLPAGAASTPFSTNTQTPQDDQRPSHGYPSLTEAEVQRLQDIAMPYRMLAKVKISEQPSPAATESSVSLSLSPEHETLTRKNKKRKLNIEEEVPVELCQSRKRGHNAIEKRYRTNLNEKINCLRQSVPALCNTSSSEPKSADEGEDLDGETEGKTGQQKYGKAAILTRALEYIKHLENTTRRLGSDVDSLKTRVGAFEKLAMSGSIVLNRKEAVIPNITVTVKSETLTSIQADFQQIKPRRKSSVSAPMTQKRSSKKAKKL